MARLRFLWVALLGVVIVGGVLWGWTWHFMNSPAGGSDSSSLIVSQGATLRPLLKELWRRGALEHPDLVYVYARAWGETAVLTGEYIIQASDTPQRILDMLREGRVKLESFTLPEGQNRWQVRDFLAENRWISPDVFDQLCDDVGFLTEHRIPGPSCDGYLFPETYTFARGIPAKKIFAEMFRTFHNAFTEITSSGHGPLGLSERELVTLASIVEKETGAPKERPHIACVFYNRLKAKPRWRLDTDPTVIYAARMQDSTFDGNLTRAHLRKLDSPYNTYRVYGLPPGPIASPGRAALEAVVAPATCDDFFFVSMNNGHHEFCPTLSCHNRAVQKWQVDYFKR